MAEDDELKHLRRKVYMTYFQDGLWDILLGVFLLGWGLMLRYQFFAAIGGLWVGFYFIVLAMKRILIYPRAGYVRVTGERRQKLGMLIMGVVMFFMGVAVVLLFTVSTPPDWLREYFMLLFGGMMALVILILAFWWQVLRWYVYAPLVFAFFPMQQWLGLPVHLAFAIPGVIIALGGFALLARFLSKYPRIDEEAPHGQG